MKISERQIKAIISLPGSQRYEHFVKQVADREEVWGLFEDGWALSSDDFDQRSLPVWCAAEYAELLREDEWKNYKPRSIALDDFLNELLPDLASKGMSVFVMYLPRGEGVVVAPGRLAEDIVREVETYY